ncbi:MAG: hypothetical protein ABIQ04_01740 [Candidatus Saccharimonadales bacterium]
MRHSKTPENRAIQAVSTLKAIDVAIDNDDLSIAEIRHHVVTLSQSLGYDRYFSGEFFEHSIAIKPTSISKIKNRLSVIGLGMPIHHPTEEAFKTINENNSYISTSLELLARIADGHEDCIHSPFTILAPHVKQPLTGHRHCMKLEAVRFAIGSDLRPDVQSIYVQVYGKDYVAFRRSTIDGLEQSDMISKVTHGLAHKALDILSDPYTVPPAHHYKEDE